MIVAFCGEKRSGKDTAADILVKDFEFTKLSFAEPLKTACSIVFNLDKKYFFEDEYKDLQFENPIQITQELANSFITYISKLQYIEEDKKVKAYNSLVFSTFYTPRQILQFLGTNIVRDCIDSNFWVNLLLSRIEDNVVISDCRMENERNVLRDRGAILVMVKRNSTKKDLHSTENNFGEDGEYSVIIDNNGSLIEYINNIKLWWFYKRKEVRL